MPTKVFYMLHEGNADYETWTDNENSDGRVLRLQTLRNNGVGGARSVTMRYKGWVGNWVGGCLVKMGEFWELSNNEWTLKA